MRHADSDRCSPWADARQFHECCAGVGAAHVARAIDVCRMPCSHTQRAGALLLDTESVKFPRGHSEQPLRGGRQAQPERAWCQFAKPLAEPCPLREGLCCGDALAEYRRQQFVVRRGRARQVQGAEPPQCGVDHGVVTAKISSCNDIARVASTEAECSGAQPVGPIAPGVHLNDGVRVVLVANRDGDCARAVGGERCALDVRVIA